MNYQVSITLEEWDVWREGIKGGIALAFTIFDLIKSIMKWFVCGFYSKTDI